MSIKYDNSMYTAIPPIPFINEDSNPVEDYYEELIDEHIDEEQYETQHIRDFDYMQRELLVELIKHEPRQSV